MNNNYLLSSSLRGPTLYLFNKIIYRNSIPLRLLFIALWLTVVEGAQAQITVPQVLSVTPSPNATRAAVSGTISVTFSESMQSGSASSSALRMHSSQSGGQLPGSSSGGGTPTLNFQAVRPLRFGETIQVAVAKSTASTAGVPLAKPYLYQFTTSTAASTGTFASPGVQLPSAAYTYGVTTADYNGDGILDIATCSQYTSSKLQVRFGNGDGTFGSSSDYPMVPAYFLTSADLDNDADLDILVAGGGSIFVLLNNGAGTFTALPGYRVGNDARTIAPADLDGDGNLDILVASASDGAVQWRFGLGNGSFSTTRGSYMSINAPVGVAAGDLDNDGDIDFVTATAQGTNAYTRINDGNGNFSAGSTIGVGAQPNSVALGDLNNDGALDILTANQGYGVNSVTVLLNNNTGTGSFRLGSTVATGLRPPDVKIGDIDGDGDLDFVAAGSSTVVRLNNGNGVFTVGNTIAANTYYLALADVNNDGTLDLISPSGTTNIDSYDGQQGLTVRLNVDSPSITSFTPGSGPVGASVTIIGTRLANTSGVSFNGIVAPGFTVNSSTSVTATVPTGTTSGRIVVTTLPGVTAASATNFTVPAPFIASISPSAGPAGTVVTIEGSGFAGTTGVTFSSVPATMLVVNPSGTTIMATAPTGVQTGPLVVTAPSGSSNSVVYTGAPVLLSLTPAFGPEGTPVVISGVGLQAATSVTFNGAAASGFSVNADGTELRVSSPTNATSGPVVVTTPNGASNGNYPWFTAAPVITGFTPDQGAVGTVVTVRGTNFSGTSQVRFGAAAASTFTVNSPTQLTAMVPAGASTGPVRVQTPGGTAISSVSFTVPAPILTALSPSSGAAYTAVTITGSGFNGASAVMFNGVAASYFFVNSGTSIMAYAPIGVITGPVLVLTPGGDSNGILFTAAPIISSISPASGAIGTSVTVTGSNFDNATQVLFNNTPAQTFAVVSATQITAVVPELATSGRVQVTTPAGVATSNTTFIIPPPQLTSISPATGPAGTSVLLTGSGLLGTTGVAFNGISAPGAVVSPDGTSITVAAPVGVTTGLVVVTTRSGRSNGVLYTGAPTLISLSPNFGSAGTQLVINGNGLSGVTRVTFNNRIVTDFTVAADGTSIAVTAPLDVSTGAVVVSNSNGSSNGLTFTLPPSISNLTPAVGTIGSSVVISGTDLSGASQVLFNTTRATSFSINSSSQITAVVPNGATSGQVHVTTLAGTASSSTGFTIPSPAISSLAPASGPVGSLVTITGTSLRDAAQVAFNGTVTTGFSVNASGTTLVVAVPVGASTGSVVVTTLNGTSNRLVFTVGPTITGISPNFGSPGTSVMLTGRNFLSATIVTFNGISAPDFVVDNGGTIITVPAPTGVQTGPVVVTSPDGVSNGVLFTAAPLIASFSPASGHPGTSVVITGTDLQGATSVRFNGLAAASYSVSSSRQIVAVVPVGATTGAIQVISPRGGVSSLAAFEVLPPAITTLTPSTGPEGSSIIIAGTGFLGTSSVTFNGTSAPGFTVNNAGTAITVQVPGGATSGPVKVVVPNAVSNVAAFVVVPAITAIAPLPAPVGTTITITGTSFSTATAVLLNGVPMSDFVLLSATSITVRVPVGASSGLVKVVSPDGQSNSFALLVPPTIMQVVPVSNASNVSVGAGVSVDFSRPVNSSTASNQSVRVFSSQQQGLQAGTYSGSNTATVSMSPAAPWRAGETLQLVVATTAKAIDGTSVAKPYVSEFTTATSPSPGFFAGGNAELSTTGSSYAVAVADFNGDGYMDLAAPSNGTVGAVTICYSNSQRVFTRTSTFTVGASFFLTAADVDNDGDLDVLVSLRDGQIKILRNRGQYQFTLENGPYVYDPRKIVPADLNGDGNLDLVIACVDGGVAGCFGRGDGTFAASVALTVWPTRRVVGLAIGDIDKDGDLDLIAPDAFSNNVIVRLNNGSGAFSTSATLPVAAYPENAVLGDVNQDGALDMLVVNSSDNRFNNRGSVSVFLNNGFGVFGNSIAVPMGSNPTDIKVGDVDGDGDMDIATCDNLSNSVSIALNTGQGTFAASYPISVGIRPHYMALVDVDGDGTLDITTGNSQSPPNSAISIRLNKEPQYMWTGAVSSDWFTTDNWQPKRVPTASDDAFIPGALTTYPIITTGLVSSKNLVIAAGSTFTLGQAASLELNGDLTNDGAAALEGTVVFRSSLPQTIMGVATSAFRTLEVNKPAGTLTLQQAIVVTNALRMAAGVMLTNDYELTTSGATIYENNRSFVIGTVVSTADVATPATRYTFGNLGIVVTPTAGAMPGRTTVRRVTGKTLLGQPAITSVKRYYDIQAVTNAGLNITLEMSYLNAELNAVSEDQLSVLRSTSGTSGPWERVAFSIRDTLANVVTVTGVDHFSIWTLGIQSIPLPVELTQFTARRASPAQVQLLWATAQERNNAGFAVQKSTDGRQWKEIGFVPGYGNSSIRQTYSLQHAEVNAAYYRLAQRDQNGTVTLSSVQFVAGQVAVLSVYPNPSRSSVQVVGAASEAEVVLLTLQGQVLRRFPAGTTTLELGRLPAGIYMVRSGQQGVRLAVE